MEVKAWYCASTEVLLCRISNRRHIKDIIKICGQDQHSTVITQLQSLLMVCEGIHGKRLTLNFGRLKEQ